MTAFILVPIEIEVSLDDRQISRIAYTNAAYDEIVKSKTVQDLLRELTIEE